MTGVSLKWAQSILYHVLLRSNFWINPFSQLMANWKSKILKKKVVKNTFAPRWLSSALDKYWHLSSYHTVFHTWSDEDLIRRPSNSQRNTLQTELLPPVAFSPPTKWFVQTLKGVPKCKTLQWLSTLNNEQIFVKEIRPSVRKTDQSELQVYGQ